MTEEQEKYIRDLLPKFIDTSEFDIWSCDWLRDGIEDFTHSAMKKDFRVRLVSKDYRMEITLHFNRKP